MVRRMQQWDLSAFSPRVTAPLTITTVTSIPEEQHTPVGISGHEAVGKGPRGTQAHTLILGGKGLVTCPAKGTNSNTGGVLEGRPSRD